jgi:hypothetical protein
MRETTTPDGLARFLVIAKAESYAADDERRVLALDDGGSESSFTGDGFTYRDRWWGGARFAGQELVWWEGRAVWAMSFQGATDPSAPPEFPHFHKRALRRVPAEAPFRGPPLHREGDLLYVNEWSGELSAFRGRERVLQGEREIYRLDYLGGAVG